MTSGLPVFFFVITTVLSLTPGPITAFVSTALSSIAVLNPLTTIFFMRCYRDVVLGRFKKNRSNRIMGEGAVTGIELTDAVAN
ncbi:hypothetical protein AAVH_21398 [Aphelenchoides avenae]|nr:hypothetical protein AAVH_21398 [Aphelenchus avenae]